MIIYKATNKINGKVYIGYTMRTLLERKKEHIKRTRLNSKFHFHNAIRKYGIENFKFEILHTCENISEMKNLERYYIAEYGKTTELYNMTKGGDGVHGIIFNQETRDNIRNKLKNLPEDVKKRLAEGNRERMKNPITREKISKSLTGKKQSIETRQKRALKMKGRKHTDETKKNLSLAKMENKNPMFGKIQSEESRKKRSVAMKGRISPMKGRKQSEKFMEMVRNRTPWNKGKKCPQLGKENHPMYGKHHSEETKNKISKNRKGKTVGENHPMYGKHHTEEAKLKNRIAHLELYDGDKNPFYGKRHTVETIK